MENKKDGIRFEGFSVGDRFLSGSRSIKEIDLVDFAEVTGDKNRIHLDPVFAESSIYGERVAHGLLGLSVVSGLAVETGFAKDTAVALRNLRWKFTHPVKIDDEIRAIFTVTDKKEIKGQEFGMVKFAVDVLNQNDKKVQVGSWSLLILKNQA